MSLWNNLADPVFNGVGLSGFKSVVNAFFLALADRSFSSSAVLSFSSFFLWIVFFVAVFVLIGCEPLSLGFALLTFFNYNNIIITGKHSVNHFDYSESETYAGVLSAVKNA